MVDLQHGDKARLVTDLVDHSISASSGRPQPGEFSLQGMTDSARVLAEGTDHELHDGSGDSFGKAGELAFG